MDPDPKPVGSETFSRIWIRKKSFRIRNEFEKLRKWREHKGNILAKNVRKNSVRIRNQLKSRIWIRIKNTAHIIYVHNFDFVLNFSFASSWPVCSTNHKSKHNTPEKKTFPDFSCKNLTGDVQHIFSSVRHTSWKKHHLSSQTNVICQEVSRFLNFSM